MKIYIIGHTSPDLDTVSSAYTYAEFLKSVEKYKNAEIIPVRAGTISKEVEFVFKKYNAEIPLDIENVEIQPTDKFILVDHNEESHRSPKVQNNNIIEILDHHKVVVSFPNPIEMNTKPLGCTGTLIYELYTKASLTPSKTVAELIVSSIISDTIGLKSPTTTTEDKSVAESISKEFGIDLETLTFEVFKSKADLTGLTTEQIVNKDFKVFDFSGTKVFIGQVETVEPAKVLEQKAPLLEKLAETRASQNSQMAFLFITDILKLYSVALYSTDEEKAVIEKAFNTTGIDNVINVGPFVSRKKDLVPAFEKAFRD